MIDKRKVCVVGTGHIGLPLAAVLAEAGFEVTGYDTNDNFVSHVNTTGSAGFREEGLLRRYLEVDGAWRDHLLVAITIDELNGSAASSLVREGHASWT